MTSRKIKIWSAPIAHAQTIELALPAYWIEEEFYETGEKRKMFCRLAENGVRTQITRSTNGYRDPVWSIETTFSTAWSDPHAVMKHGFVTTSPISEQLTVAQFDEIEAKMSALMDGVAVDPLPKP